MTLKLSIESIMDQLQASYFFLYVFTRERASCLMHIGVMFKRKGMGEGNLFHRALNQGTGNEAIPKEVLDQILIGRPGASPRHIERTTCQRAEYVAVNDVEDDTEDDARRGATA